MCSKEGKDGRERADIVRGRLGFFGGEVNVAVEDSNKNVLISPTGFNGHIYRQIHTLFV